VLSHRGETDSPANQFGAHRRVISEPISVLRASTFMEPVAWMGLESAGRLHSLSKEVLEHDPIE